MVKTNLLLILSWDFQKFGMTNATSGNGFNLKSQI